MLEEVGEIDGVITPHVLLVEDEPDTSELVRALLERGGAHVVTPVTTLAAAVAHLTDAEVDVALVDLGLPDSQGVTTVSRLVGSFPDLPVVVLSGSEEGEAAPVAVRAGAQDYVPKSNLDRFTLTRTIRYAIERSRWQRLLRAEAAQLRVANARLDDFAATVAHDLKSPLSSLYGMAETLALVDEDGLTEPQRELLARLGDAALRASQVVDGLLDNARHADRQRRQRIELTQLARDVASDVAVATPAGPAQIVVGDLPTVWGVPVLLSQVLSNLMANAIAHHPQTSPPRIEVTADVRAGVVITVSDDGPGIPEELRSEVFVSGFTTRTGGESHAGLGRGLALCWDAVHELGGRIWIEDGRLGGSDVRFSLPTRTTATV